MGLAGARGPAPRLRRALRLGRRAARQRPLSGELFLFTNKNRTGCKVLSWDGTGLCLFVKRLERGRFATLWRAETDAAVALTASELALYVEGSALVGKIVLSPSPIVPKTVARDRACDPLGP